MPKIPPLRTLLQESHLLSTLTALVPLPCLEPNGLRTACDLISTHHFQSGLATIKLSFRLTSHLTPLSLASPFSLTLDSIR